MAVSCVIKSCTSSSEEDNKGVHFFSLPEIIFNQGGETQGLSLKRRLTWLAIIGCDEIDTTSSLHKICSRHFKSGRPSDLNDENSEDWVPSINLDFDEVIELIDDDDDDDGDGNDENKNSEEPKEEREGKEKSPHPDEYKAMVRESQKTPSKRKWAVSFKRKRETDADSEDEVILQDDDIDEDNNNKDNSDKKKDETSVAGHDISGEDYRPQTKRYTFDLDLEETSIVSISPSKPEKPKVVSSLLASKPESKKLMSPQKSPLKPTIVPDVVVISDSDDEAPATPVKPPQPVIQKPSSQPKFSPEAFRKRKKSKKEEFLCMFNLVNKSLVPKKEKDEKEEDVPTRKKLRLRTCQLQKINYREDFDYDLDSEEEVDDHDDDEDFVVSGSPSPPKKQLVTGNFSAPASVQLQKPRPQPSVTKSQNMGLYMCTLCKLMFNGKHFYDKHMDTEHRNRQDGTNGIFECELCKVVLPNKNTYLEHKRVQHPDNVKHFTCTKCRGQFQSIAELQHHNKFQCKSKQAERWVVCDICSLRFPSLVVLNQHKLDLHYSNCYKCQNRGCTFKAQTRDDLKHHILTTHVQTPSRPGKETFLCLIAGCNMSFSSELQLSIHSQVHSKTTSDMFFCRDCSQSFSSDLMLQRHKKIEKAIQKRQCDLCLRDFSTKDKLEKHKQIHVCKGLIQCKDCTRWFLDADERQQHICRVKKVVVPNYFCDVCGEDFSVDKKMFEHREAHRRFYQCGKCFWEATTEAEYFDHRQIHMLYNCTICCEEFPTEKELETHRKAHNFHVKTQNVSDGDSQPVMFLCPNVLQSMINIS